MINTDNNLSTVESLTPVYKLVIFTPPFAMFLENSIGYGGKLFLNYAGRENKVENSILPMGLVFKIAERKHLNEIVRLLSDDVLGRSREAYGDPLPEGYLNAFEIISKDPSHELTIAENEQGDLVGTMQLSFIQYLTYRGGLRAHIEDVHIRQEDRGKGYGTLFFQYAINRAKKKGAHLLQLTTDKQRPEAIAFYTKMGFIASHEGMKMHFSE